MEFLTPTLTVALVIVASLLLIGLIISRMYVRADKDRAFVRTGTGGPKVVMDGGALVIPVIHEKIMVNLQTLQLQVTREGKEALISKDRIRADVVAEFYVRVKGEKDKIMKAAQTLGDRTLNQERLKDHIEGKFVDALRAVAAKMELTELHEERERFVQEVQDTLQEDLAQNGLELESVSLTSLDQTPIGLMVENNAFDAEGKSKVVETVQKNKELQNQYKRDAEVAIADQDLAAEKRKLEVEREEEELRAQQQADIQKKREAAKREEEEARIEREQAVDEAEIRRDERVDIADQERQIAIANKSRETSKAEQEASNARAEAVKAEEKVKTVQAKAEAERNKEVALIKAEEEEREKALGITVEAEAEQEAAEHRAKAIRTIADAQEREYEVEAEGKRALHEAENALSPEIVDMRIRLALIEALPQILEQITKPIEQIDRISVVEAGGLFGHSGGFSANGQSAGGSGNFVNDFFGGLQQYQLQLPILRSLLKEAGVNDLSPEGISSALAEMQESGVELEEGDNASSELPEQIAEAAEADHESSEESS